MSFFLPCMQVIILSKCSCFFCRRPLAHGLIAVLIPSSTQSEMSINGYAFQCLLKETSNHQKQRLLEAYCLLTVIVHQSKLWVLKIVLSYLQIPLPAVRNNDKNDACQEDTEISPSVLEGHSITLRHK